MCLAICSTLPFSASVPTKTALDSTDVSHTQVDPCGSQAGGGIGVCEETEEKVRGADGVRRYKIDVSTARLLEEFFAPYNTKLFELLGRKLEW